MKLTVTDVQYGLVPYGPGTGNRAIGVYIDAVDGDFDYKSDVDENGKPLSENKDVINAAGLLKDIIAKITEKGFTNEWSKFLLGHDYVYFISEEMASPDFRHVCLSMFEGISHMAVEIQKKALEEIKVGKERMEAMKRQLSAPKPVLVCSPKYYTGRDTFYEAFNLVLLKLPLDKSTINPMTMVEVANHAFSVYIIEMDSDKFDEQVDNLKTTYEDVNALALNPMRIFVIDKSDDDKIAKFALDRGFRCNRKMSYSKEYQLEM